MDNKLKNIEHPGIVEGIKNKRVLVRIQTRGACGDCKSKSYCGFYEMKDKIIEVATKNADNYNPGENVTVALKESLGYKALLIGYLYPLILLVIVLASMILITSDELLSALAAVIVMVPYYVLVYYFRDKLRKTFNFYLK